MLTAARMTRGTQIHGLTGVSQRDSTYQARISAGYDPVTGRRLG